MDFTSGAEKKRLQAVGFPSPPKRRVLHAARGRDGEVSRNAGLMPFLGARGSVGGRHGRLGALGDLTTHPEHIRLTRLKHMAACRMSTTYEL